MKKAGKRRNVKRAGAASKKASPASRKGVAPKRNASAPALKSVARAERSFSRPLVSPPPKGAWHFPVRKAGERWFWLLKQEPTDFSFDDLWTARDRTTNWNGVRNFAARNFLRDYIKAGDHAFFYHSSADPSAVVGIVEVVRDGYADASALARTSPYYDADATAAEPIWYQVDVRAIERFARPIPLAELKTVPALGGLVLLHISQLSVQPVTKAEWDAITRLARRT